MHRANGVHKRAIRAFSRQAAHPAHPAPPLLSYASGVSTKPLSGDTVGQILDRTVAKWGSRPAVISPWEKVNWTYEEFGHRVDCMAAAMLDLGLQRGDPVGIWSPSSSSWMVAKYAAAKAGLVSVWLNPAYRPAELQYALNKVGVKALFLAESFKTSHYVAMLREVVPELDGCKRGHLSSQSVPSLRHVVLMNNAHVPGAWRFDDLLAVGSAPEDIAEMHAASALLDRDDVCNVQFSSGTTGKPKAVLLTHHSIVNNAIIVQDNIGMTEKDVCIGNAPLYHCMGGVMAALGCATRGAAYIIPAYGFDGAAALRAAVEYKGTAVWGVPTMFVAMFKALEEAPALKAQLGSLRTGIMAGSVCPVELMRRVESDLGIRELAICYGMTETAPVSVQTARNDPEWARTETVGRVVPHTEVKIIDPATGLTVPRGQRGELCTRGYCVMKGYLGEPEKTAESIVNGFMRTGDLAEMDEQGYVRIVGRLKDMISRGGEKIYPREVEDVLLGMPSIQDASVFGVHDATMGEEVAVSIVRKPGAAGAALSEAGVREYLKPRVSHYKVPRYIRFVEDFPKTASGKIQKFIMRAELELELKEAAAEKAEKK